MTDSSTRELLDHVGVTRLQQAYADLATRRAWDELDQLFLPDARIVIAVGGGEERRIVLRALDGPWDARLDALRGTTARWRAA